MDWESENWRKLYTRETAAWACLDWQAQACLLMFIKTCEADGTIKAPRGPSQVARLWRGWPVEVVETGLQQLEEDGTVTRSGGVYAMPNFAAAQAARTSAKVRKARQREQERAAIAALGQGAPAYKVVTRGHTTSQQVTAGHERKKEREKEREKEPTATATPQKPVNPRAATYAGGWAKGRAVLQELTDDLDRRVSWPLTPPEGWWEGVTASGGVDALSEALRRVRDGIKNGTIEPDRWHGRMFYGRAWPALMLKLDEIDTQQAARDRARKADEERWKKNEQNERPTLTGEEFQAISRAFGLGDS